MVISNSFDSVDACNMNAAKTCPNYGKLKFELTALIILKSRFKMVLLNHADTFVIYSVIEWNFN